MKREDLVGRLLARISEAEGLSVLLEDPRVRSWFVAMESRAIEEAMNAAPDDDDARREAIIVLKVVRGLRGDLDGMVQASKSASDRLESMDNDSSD